MSERLNEYQGTVMGDFTGTALFVTENENEIVLNLAGFTETDEQGCDECQITGPEGHEGPAILADGEDRAVLYRR